MTRKRSPSLLAATRSAKHMVPPAAEIYVGPEPEGAGSLEEQGLGWKNELRQQAFRR